MNIALPGSSSNPLCGAVLIVARSGQDENLGNRTAADLERELAMLAHVRDRLPASKGQDFRIPATAVVQVLDELKDMIPPRAADVLVAMESAVSRAAVPGWCGSDRMSTGRCRAHVRGSQLRRHGEQGDRGDGDPRDASKDAQ
ncbi:MAG: hypothetical protein EOO27_44870 [Comamonadaceae bacterium]|nr:MAG: hypothetical protein EOO27_44870 [Comamonadaceae bacterium]